MKKPALLSIAAVPLLLLSACGSSEPEPAASGSTEPVAITVGVLPIVDTAPIWLGESLGYFDEVGLDMTLEVTTGGGPAVQGVQAGDFDFAFGNVISVMVGRDSGIDLRYATNGTTTAGVVPDFGAVVTNPDSGITSAADLAGKTVSVNVLNNIGDTTIRAAVEAAGGDPAAVNFTEIAFPDAPAALENGQVDAAWILDPFLTQALTAGAEVVTWNYVEFDPSLDIAGYFSLGETADSDPELVAKFAEAMNRSLEYAQENPDEVREIVTTYTTITAETAAAITLPVFRTEFDRDALTKLGAAAAKYGTLSAEPDLDTLLPQ